MPGKEGFFLFFSGTEISIQDQGSFRLPGEFKATEVFVEKSNRTSFKSSFFV